MFNYRELTVNGVAVDLDDNETIALNRQVNDIAELKDRQADFSTDFKLELTRKNARALGFPHLLNSGSVTPYRLNVAKYSENGIELVSNGVLVVTGVKGSFATCVLYSGIASFFTLVEGLKLSALNLSDLNHYFDVVDGAELKYLHFEPSENGGLAGSLDYAHRYRRPFVKLSRLFTQLVEDRGWTVVGDTSYMDAWMLAQNLTPDLSGFVGTGSLSSFYQSSGTMLLNSSRFSIASDPYGLLQFNYSLGGLVGTSLLCFDARDKRHGKYRITYSGRMLFSNADSVSFKLEGNVMGLNSNPGILQDFNLVYEIDIDDTNDERLLIWAELVNPGAGSSLSVYEFSATVALVEADEPTITDRIIVASSLPDLTQKDFLKGVAGMYGLIYEADGLRRQLRVWRFDELKGRKAQAKDWSAYLHESPEDSETAFRFGSYARRNLLKYKEVSDVPAGYGDGELLIDDTTLEDSKDLLTLPFAASQDIVEHGQVIAKIPLYSKSDDGTYSDKKMAEPRVVLAKTATLPYGAGDKMAYFADFGQGRGLAFSYDLVQRGYGYLGATLDRCKVKRVKLDLPAYELLYLKHYTPVYLAQYGAYFYVNKITGWKRGSLCTAELILLK